jgi:hypothetical protein
MGECLDASLPLLSEQPKSPVDRPRLTESFVDIWQTLVKAWKEGTPLGFGIDWKGRNVWCWVNCFLLGIQHAQVVAAVIMVVRAVHRLDNLTLHATVACISGYEDNNTTGQPGNQTRQNCTFLVI